MDGDAPVLGVRGRDDADDLRTRRAALVLSGEGYRIGCVHDAKAAGLAARVDPFVETERAPAICGRLFGGTVDVLLHAGAEPAGRGPVRRPVARPSIPAAWSGPRQGRNRPSYASRSRRRGVMGR